MIFTTFNMCAMLAEKKVKEKWTQDPRNTLWTNGVYILNPYK